MIFFWSCVLLVAAPAAQDQEPELRYQSMLSEPLENGEILYHLERIDLRSPELHLRADRGWVRFHGERYTEVAQGSRLIGDFGADLLGRPGEPVREPVILEIQLEGAVQIETPERLIECDWLVQLPGEGRLVMHHAQITIPGKAGINGWPWRLRAEVLAEEGDGSLVAHNAAVTACHLKDPAYALTMRELRATRNADGKYVWSPSSTWLTVAKRKVVPMPSFDFQAGDGDSGFGVRSLRLSTGRQLGTAIELGASYRTKIHGDPFELSLLPMWSSRRGFPLRVLGEYRSENFRTDLDLFTLSDQADDVHPLSNFVGRDNDQRWRIRSQTTWDISELWRLHFDLSATSDPLVDPEFFQRDWITGSDSINEVYLRRVDDDSFFSAVADYRIDEVGFTPIEGYGPRGGPAPQQLDLLPQLRWERFSKTLTSWDSEVFGGADGAVPVQFSYGAEAGRYRLEELDVVPARPSNPFTASGDIARDRVRAWFEIAAPMQWQGLSLTPGMRVEAGGVNEPSVSGSSDGQASTEIYLETSAVFERRTEDGWTHRVRPSVRLRDRIVHDRPGAEWFFFDAFDQRRPGQAAEFSLRQFWYGAGSARPWLDLNLLIPYYPDSTEPLDDGLFPGFRSGQANASWGPAEMRLVWDPGVEQGLLRGVRATTNLRQNFRAGTLEEIFTRLSVAPTPNWRVATWFRSLSETSVTDPFTTTGFQASWRINDTWSFEAGQTFTQRGNSATRSRYGFTYHGNGFAFELSASRNEATGDSRYSFAILPCFLTDPYRGANF